MELILEIDDSKKDFFLELIEDLPFVKIKKGAEEWHKKLLDERIKEFEENPEQVVSWESVKAEIEALRKNSHTY